MRVLLASGIRKGLDGPPGGVPKPRIERIDPAGRLAGLPGHEVPVRGQGVARVSSDRLEYDGESQALSVQVATVARLPFVFPGGIWGRRPTQGATPPPPSYRGPSRRSAAIPCRIGRALNGAVQGGIAAPASAERMVLSSCGGDPIVAIGGCRNLGGISS